MPCSATSPRREKAVVELGALGGEAQVAHQRLHQADAGARTVHGSDDRLGIECGKVCGQRSSACSSAAATACRRRSLAAPACPHPRRSPCLRPSPRSRGRPASCAHCSSIAKYACSISARPRVRRSGPVERNSATPSLTCICTTSLIPAPSRSRCDCYERTSTRALRLYRLLAARTQQRRRDQRSSTQRPPRTPAGSRR